MNNDDKNIRIALRVANVLSWFNLLWWGINLLFSLPSLLSSGPVLVMTVLLAAIPLHAYAALQLHKSIRNPSIKLGSQTPVGIRFVGLVAQLFGIVLIICGIFILANISETLPILKKQGVVPAGTNDLVAAKTIKALGVFAIFLGLSASVNVILNLRLLRWYYLVKQSDIS